MNSENDALFTLAPQSYYPPTDTGTRPMIAALFFTLLLLAALDSKYNLRLGLIEMISLFGHQRAASAAIFCLLALMLALIKFDRCGECHPSKSHPPSEIRNTWLACLIFLVLLAMAIAEKYGLTGSASSATVDASSPHPLDVAPTA